MEMGGHASASHGRLPGRVRGVSLGCRSAIGTSTIVGDTDIEIDIGVDTDTVVVDIDIETVVVDTDMDIDTDADPDTDTDIEAETAMDIGSEIAGADNYADVAALSERRGPRRSRHGER